MCVCVCVLCKSVCRCVYIPFAKHIDCMSCPCVTASLYNLTPPVVRMFVCLSGIARCPPPRSAAQYGRCVVQQHHYARAVQQLWYAGSIGNFSCCALLFVGFGCFLWLGLCLSPVCDYCFWLCWRFVSGVSCVFAKHTLTSLFLCRAAVRLDASDDLDSVFCLHSLTGASKHGNWRQQQHH